MTNIVNFIEKKEQLRPKHDKEDATVEFLHKNIFSRMQEREKEAPNTQEKEIYKRILECAKEEDKEIKEILTEKVRLMLGVNPLTTNYLEQQMQKIGTEMYCALMEVFLLKYVKVLKPDLKYVILMENNNNNKEEKK